jgi:hypothetical protein
MSTCPETQQAALDFLKGKENPFDSLARPQRLDDRFQDLHVPELLEEERDLLLKIIAGYSVERYRASSDLPQTRVVTILGSRGSGKTHLLQSLIYRNDGKSQILVRPNFYDPHLPMAEFLLGQLMATLATEDELFRSRPIDDLAAALTRRLLRQALRSLGPTERLFALSPSGWKSWGLLAGGAQRESQGLERLIADLDSAENEPNLAQLAQRQGLEPERCLRLIRGHLNRHEPGTHLLAALRRRLYTAMAEFTLLGDSDPLESLLDGQYSDGNVSPSTRVETVARLLHAVTEVCALLRQPIVFAFDNLEQLFMPQNQLDGELIRKFFNSLAQAVDTTRGIIILLFAEQGLLEQAFHFVDAFARDRLEQGVPIQGRGPTTVVRLNPPGPAAIRGFVRNRIRAVLGGFADASELPEDFPLGNDALTEAVADNQTLRDTMRRLRDLYSTRIYQQPPPPPRPHAVLWESLLETHWQDQLKIAGRKLESGLAGHLQDLHAGLATLLKPLLPVSLDRWQLTEIQATAQIGDNPTYGVATLLTWSAEGDALKVGVGFLLARGTGMPHDLRSKLDFFRRPRKGDRLLILWPTTSDCDDLAEALPTATRAAWDASRQKNNVVLRRVSNDELCMLLAAAEWLNAAQAAADQPPPPEAVQAFIKEKCQSLLQLISPPQPQAERISADAD